MLDQIIRWAELNQSVRAILLVGSMAKEGKHDSLSDYDISIFGESFDFIGKDDWLIGIAPPLICIHEQFLWDDNRIPTRLTIFQNFTKADFAFHPSSLLKKMAYENLLTATYDAGYEVLLDKDGLTIGLPKPTFRAYKKAKPTPQEFDNCIREFWFETYHVAKYLAREDLWVAQVRAHDMRKWLLMMLEWNAAGFSGFTLRMKGDGKDMHEWISPSNAIKVRDCFAGGNLNTLKSSLSITMSFFSELAKETSWMLGFEYADTVDHAITNFVATLILTSHDISKIKRQ